VLSRNPWPIILRRMVQQGSRGGARGTARAAVWLVVGLASLAGCATRAPQPAPPLPPPVPVVEQPAPPSGELWISIRKGARSLALHQGSTVIRTYPVVLGTQPVGAKLFEGDRRTPEGEYHTVKKYYHPYWSRFMLIDYPTPANRDIYTWSRSMGVLPARGGGTPGIGGAVGIHGAEDESLNQRGIDWTLGCISLFNRDVDELYELVTPGARVVISP